MTSQIVVLAHINVMKPLIFVSLINIRSYISLILCGTNSFFIEKLKNKTNFLVKNPYLPYNASFLKI